MANKSTESINYYLRNGEGYKNAVIYLQFWFNNTRLRYNLKEKIDPNKWNPKKQKAKDGIMTGDGKYLLNDFLDNVATIVKDAYRAEKVNGMPTPALIKKHLDAFINQHHDAEAIEAARPTLMALIDRFISGQIKHKGQSKAANTLKTYTTTKHHLEGYAAHTKQPLDFESITLDFYYKWVEYLQAKAKLGPNAIGKMVQILKVFMSEAVDLGYTNNMAFKHRKFAVGRVDTDAVYLSEAEIMAFYNHDLSNTPGLERARDLFVFGCNVGLRYSDYSNVKPQNIVEVDGQQFIYIRTKKTREVVYIPCNPVVLDIFNKYANSPNKLPKALSEQAFNRYIKEAAKAAGMTETGRLLNDPDAELWESITSHTARRSFATNYYLDSFPTVDLMKITGHKTEKAFLRYIKISKLDAAKRMADHNRRKNWAVLMGGIQERQLKVAS